MPRDSPLEIDGRDQDYARKQTVEEEGALEIVGEPSDRAKRRGSCVEEDDQRNRRGLAEDG